MSNSLKSRQVSMEMAESVPVTSAEKSAAALTVEPILTDPGGPICDKRGWVDDFESPSSSDISPPTSKRVQLDPSTPDHLSLKSDSSMIQPLIFSEEDISKDISFQAHSSAPDNLSMKSDGSMIQPLQLRPSAQFSEVIETGDIGPSHCQIHCSALSVFCLTDQIPICKKCAVQEHSEHEKQYIKIPGVPDTLTTLQDMLGSMKVAEFRQFKRNLSHEYLECFNKLNINCSVQLVAKMMMKSFSEDQVLKVALQLAAVKQVFRCQEKIKEKLRKKLTHIHEGLALPKTQTVLYDTYTELYITEGGSDATQNEHEVRIIEKCAKRASRHETPINLRDIFKSPSESKDIRAVLTKGIAGIGKTVWVQKFILDWAENTGNQDIDLILPIFFRDLNLEKKEISLMELLWRYFPELKDIERIENGIKVLLVLDGLDECRLTLDFENTRMCCDITEPSSVDVLLTNLIKGNLLPTSLLWITSRPAATNQIPSQYLQRVTEVRGFRDDQKEEYFYKKCKTSEVADKIIKYMKSCRSIHVMCQIPIFCWMMATVLDVLLNDAEFGEIPKNQTQLFSHYLFIQTGLKNRKYQKAINGDLHRLTEDDKKMILNLAKLAFHELKKGNLVFYEDDLKQCGIDINEASDFSSVCTQLFREEFGLYRERVFCFLHLNVQEHLAAVHVLCTYLNDGINVLDSCSSASTSHQTTLTDVLKSAVDKAVQDKNGNFDQFLLFLLGLSVEPTHKLLQSLVQHPQKLSQRKDEIVSFIKNKISQSNITATASINLFHCLNEMNHDYLVKEMQESVKSGNFSEKELKPEHCSALAFVLLMSEDVMDEFNLSMYKTEPSGRQRLLPIVRASKKAVLSDCKLSSKACDTVASALRIGNSPVRELDLSHNAIRDSGVETLCKGLQSPHCQLEILRLAKCNITSNSCKSLADALQNTESHLQELDLSFNKLTNTGIDMLKPWLTSEPCKVQRLGFRQCHLTRDYCRSLTEVLRSSRTKQIELDLKENNL